MARRDAPHVILFLVDTLRADHLSCYGHHRRTSPRLDAFAEDATLYAAAVSPGAWTPPSHASIFTGTYPSRHGVDRTHPYLDGPLTTLPEYLKAHGYRTFGVSSNYWIGAATCFDRGFDVFRHSWQLVQARANPALERQRQRDPAYAGSSAPRPLVERLRAGVNRLDAAIRRYCCRPIMDVDKGARRVNRTVLRWIREWERMEGPFFAFVHYMEPHLPYQAPARFREPQMGARSRERARRINQQPLKFISGRLVMTADDFDVLGRLYDGEVSYTDHCIGEILDALRATRLLDRSVVIVTSDHGENLGDHGLMDHMFSVHESIVRTPLIVRYPGAEHRGVEDGLVQTHDIFPTIASLINGTNGSGAGDDSLREQFQAQPLPPFGAPREYAVSELNEIQPPISILARRYPDFDWRRYDRSLRAVRTATEKYIRAADGTEELYAVATDPGERTNLAAARPDRLERLRAWLDGWEAGQARREVPADSPELDPDLRQRLHDLGYLQD
jgi:arylsulfatase A-like enzyme